jgi:hypothetical protein
MIRWCATIWALSAIGLLAATSAGCNPPACGPGTKQVQQANGTIQCVPADGIANGNVVCDVDGGTVDIVSGQCVSHIKCDPATTKYDPTTGVCVGTGGGGTNCPPCPANPGAGMTCLTGGIVDFQTGQHLMAGQRTLHVGAYEPLSFLQGNTTPITDTTDSNGCFTFTIPTPAAGLVAIGVNDPAGGPMPAGSPPLVIGGAGATIVGNKSYKVDAYMVEQSLLTGWGAVNALYNSGGAYVACYYNSTPPGPTNQIYNETMPAPGVQMFANSVLATPVNYLKPDRTIDTTLTATGTLGCALTAGNGNVNNYSGMGGGVTKWETAPGGTVANVVFVSRFHSCDGVPAGMFATCP